MKEYDSDKLRNVAVVGHGKTGKTSLLEACLFNSGAAARLGKVDDGTSLLDYDTEEEKRRMTIGCSLAVCEWHGFKLNFIDTPGYPDFVGEVKGALAAADSALIVVSATAPVEVETENAWAAAEELNLPRAIFVNKMDREHADFEKAVDVLRAHFGSGVVPVQVPVGAAETFQGVVDLLSLKMKIVKHDEEPAPEYIESDLEEQRQKLIEAVAEFNNELLEKYLEGEEITETEVAAALIEGIQAAKICPVFCGSATKNAGVKKLMDGVVEYMPTPYFKVSMGTDLDGELIERKTEDAFSAQVFKTAVDPLKGRLSYLRVFSGKMKGDAAYLNSTSGDDWQKTRAADRRRSR